MANIVSIDNDDSENSIIEIEPPRKPPPLVIDLADEEVVINAKSEIPKTSLFPGITWISQYDSKTGKSKIYRVDNDEIVEEESKSDEGSKSENDGKNVEEKDDEVVESENGENNESNKNGNEQMDDMNGTNDEGTEEVNGVNDKEKEKPTDTHEDDKSNEDNDSKEGEENGGKETESENNSVAKNDDDKQGDESNDKTEQNDESRQDDQTTEDDDTRQDDQTTEDDDTRQDDQTTEDDDTRQDDQTTEDDDTRDDDQTTEDDETRQDDQTTQDDETRQDDQTTQDDETRQDDQTTQDDETRQDDQTTQDDETRQDDQTTQDNENKQDDQTGQEDKGRKNGESREDDQTTQGDEERADNQNQPGPSSFDPVGTFSWPPNTSQNVFHRSSYTPPPFHDSPYSPPSQSKKDDTKADHPDHWTPEMVKFYDEDWGNENDFVLEKLQREMDQDPSLWQISSRDVAYWKHKDKKPVVRCFNCLDCGHETYECTEEKRDPNCHMCGHKGHIAYNCPRAVCLNCGTDTTGYVIKCKNCKFGMDKSCERCSLTGHIYPECTDHWRLYHSTIGTKRVLIPQKNIYKSPRNRWCCNCGRRGHLQFECGYCVKNSEYSDTLPFVTSYIKAFTRGSQLAYGYEEPDGPKRLKINVEDNIMTNPSQPQVFERKTSQLKNKLKSLKRDAVRNEREANMDRRRDLEGGPHRFHFF